MFGFENNKDLNKYLTMKSSANHNNNNLTEYISDLTDSMLLDSFKGHKSSKNCRNKLPLNFSNPKPNLSVWSFLKSAIGKDLSKVTLPVFFNEPLSMLQRMCEDIEYIELLSLAGRVGMRNITKRNSINLNVHPAEKLCLERGWDINVLENLQDKDASDLRIMLVSAFAMSNYSSTVGRTSKPFNPLLVFLV